VSRGERKTPQPTDWAALQYRPSSAPLLRCARNGCGAMFHDDEPGRRAHIAVFGHSPRDREPARPAPEAEIAEEDR
jgi:hypothetical protein